MCPALPKRNSIWKPFRRQLHPGHMLRALCHHSVRRHPRTSLLCTSLRLTFSTLCLQVKVRSFSTLTARKHLEMTCGCDVEPRVESVSRTSSRPISIGNSRRDIKITHPHSFAYVKGRSTLDAALRVQAHCQRVLHQGWIAEAQAAGQWHVIVAQSQFCRHRVARCAGNACCRSPERPPSTHPGVVPRP